jgi:hypothetical protein
MVTHMKTTVEVSDALLREAKRVAAQRDTTLRALIEAGLRQVLAEPKSKATFRLRRVTFKGRGLQPHAAQASWESLRALAYEGRGA